MSATRRTCRPRSDARLETFGRVDGCFANAGVSGRGGHTFLEMTSAEWHRVTRVNLDGAFYTFRTAAKHMVERGDGGVLVGTASLAAIEGAPRSEHYAATKGGMISMVKAMAVEFARYGVRAHSILPGWIETNMTANAVSTEGFKTKGAAAGADAALGRRRRFRGYRGVFDELGVEVSHRRYVCDRWRVFVVLGWIGRPRRGGCWHNRPILETEDQRAARPAAPIERTAADLDQSAKPESRSRNTPGPPLVSTMPFAFGDRSHARPLTLRFRRCLRRFRLCV